MFWSANAQVASELSPISEDMVTQLIGVAINILVGLGILVDPTSQGVSDSDRAREHDEPA